MPDRDDVVARYRAHLATEAASRDADGRVALEHHLRDAHPNLLGEGHDERFSWSPLPRDLASVPDSWLLAVHDANHEPVYRNHGGDEWKPRPRRIPSAAEDEDGRDVGVLGG